MVSESTVLVSDTEERVTIVTNLDPERIVRLEEGPPPRVVVLDQRRLPDTVVELECGTVPELVDAIRTLAVRGAPAIGVAAAYGLALAALRGDDLAEAERSLASSRPTAVNLAWALAEMRADPTPARARALHAEEVERCKRMAAHAAELFASGTRALTHCNAGGLATAATAPRSARSAPPGSEACSSTSSSTRRGPFSRARASPRGSSRPRGSRTP